MHATDPATGADLLRTLDYSVLQQCMHCGMCLPTCPTYDETKLERNSPRGRIALMRAIADDELALTRAFADEMYYCLGCLACETACPAGVDYTKLFETSRSAIEQSGILDRPVRSAIRGTLLNVLFTRPRLLRFVGRLLRTYQASGGQRLFRACKLNRLLPKPYRTLERQTPTAEARLSHQLIRPIERPANVRYRVAVLTGCVQDILFASVNRDTVDVLLANDCEVHTPAVQPCCGSLHAHNGEADTARALARRLIDQIDPASYDAIITNAAGCGSHLKNYSHLFHDDPAYRDRAHAWDLKVKDIHEWLVEIDFRLPTSSPGKPESVTYHEACHLCHGQKITHQPRAVLAAIPGLELTELPESTWCCGSAGVYNITKPEMAEKLRDRKVGHIVATRSTTVATANPGCHLQLQNGLAAADSTILVTQPVTLLARAYRLEHQT